MTEQFKQIMRSEEPMVTHGMPIVVHSYSLLADRKTGELYAQLSLFSMCESRVREAWVDIGCKDISGKKLESIKAHKFSELYRNRGQVFGEGEPVLLPDKNTRSIEVTVKKVIFIDDVTIEAKPHAKNIGVPVQQRLVDFFEDEEYAEQFNRQTNLGAEFVPLDLGEIWLCSCGAVNRKDESECHKCMLNLKKLENLLNKSKLEEGLNEYREEQVMLAKKAREEKRLKDLKAKKKRKLIKVLVPAAVLILVVVVVWATVIVPSNKYNEAWNMYYDGSMEEATDEFFELGNYKDSQRVYTWLNEKRLLLRYGLISEYSDEFGFDDIRKLRNEGIPYNIHLIEAGQGTVGIKTDGTAFANAIDADVSEWKDLIEVSAGFMHVAGLKADGTVVVAGRRHDVKEWTDVVSIKTGADHTVGLKSDGSVVAAGSNDNGQCEVDDWNNIAVIYTNGYSTVGLKKDGTVVTAGKNKHGEIELGDWEDVVEITMYGYLTLGLKEDGTVLAAGLNDLGQCEVDEWSDIVSVKAGAGFAVGLKSEGSVVVAGASEYGQHDAQEWEDIFMISAGRHHILGLKKDGSVVAAGADTYGQCQVGEWDSVVFIDGGEFHTVAIQSDGRVYVTGKRDWGECASQGKDLWKN